MVPSIADLSLGGGGRIKVPSYVNSIQPSIQQTGERHLPIPAPARERLEKAGIDLSNGYPAYPRKPKYVEDAFHRNPEHRELVDPGSRADKEKKALLGAAEKVTHLTKHIGTEIIGLQLKENFPSLPIMSRPLTFVRT